MKVCASATSHTSLSPNKEVRAAALEKRKMFIKPVNCGAFLADFIKERGTGLARLPRERL